MSDTGVRQEDPSKKRLENRVAKQKKKKEKKNSNHPNQPKKNAAEKGEGWSRRLTL